MSNEYRELEERIGRMLIRRERAQRAISELRSSVAEMDTDISSLRLQLEALRHGGDSRDKNEDNKQ